jgi:hypothetical protein
LEQKETSFEGDCLSQHEIASMSLLILEHEALSPKKATDLNSSWQKWKSTEYAKVVLENNTNANNTSIACFRYV